MQEKWSAIDELLYSTNACFKSIIAWTEVDWDISGFLRSDRGVTRGGKGSTIPRAPNHCGGRQMTVTGTEKSQQCQMYILQYSKFASERSQVRTWGRQTCFWPRAPSNLGTPLRSDCVEDCFRIQGDLRLNFTAPIWVCRKSVVCAWRDLPVWYQPVPCVSISTRSCFPFRSPGLSGTQRRPFVTLDTPHISHALPHLQPLLGL